MEMEWKWNGKWTGNVMEMAWKWNGNGMETECKWNGNGLEIDSKPSLTVHKY